MNYFAGGSQGDWDVPTYCEILEAMSSIKHTLRAIPLPQLFSALNSKVEKQGIRPPVPKFAPLPLPSCLPPSCHNTLIRTFAYTRSFNPYFPQTKLTPTLLKRYEEKRLVALAYLTYGTCKQCHLIEYLQTHKNISLSMLSKNTHYAASRGMVNDTIRTLESFLRKKVHSGIVAFNGLQIRMLYEVLFNIDRYVGVEEGQTWRKFLKIVYCLEDVSVTKEQAYRFYTQIHQCLRKRIIEKEEKLFQEQQTLRNINEFSKNHAATSSDWNPSVQRDFLAFYLKHSSMSFIGTLLETFYGKNQHFKKASLYIRLVKILNSCLKRLEQYRDKHSLFGNIVFLDMNERRKRMIFYSTEGLFTRRELSRFYLMEDGKESVKRATLVCNQLIYRMENQLMQREMLQMYEKSANTRSECDGLFQRSPLKKGKRLYKIKKGQQRIASQIQKFNRYKINMLTQQCGMGEDKRQMINDQ